MQSIKPTAMVFTTLLLISCTSTPHRIYNPIHIRHTIRTSLSFPPADYNINGIINLKKLMAYNELVSRNLKICNANINYIDNYIIKYNQFLRGFD